MIAARPLSVRMKTIASTRSRTDSADCAAIKRTPSPLRRREPMRRAQRAVAGGEAREPALRPRQQHRADAGAGERRPELQRRQHRRRRAGQIGRVERAERAHQRRRRGQRQRARRGRDHQRLEAGLPAQAGVICAERQPHGEFAATPFAVGEQQVDQVDQRDDEHGADRSGDEEQHRPRRLGDLVLDGIEADPCAPPVRLRVLLGQAFRDRTQFQSRLLECRRRTEAANSGDPAGLARAFPESALAGDERHPDVVLRRGVDDRHRFKHADNAPRLVVERHRPADDGDIAAELAPPERVREDQCAFVAARELGRIEQATVRGADAEHAIEIPADAHRVEAARLATTGQRRRMRGVGADRRHRFRCGAPVVDIEQARGPHVGHVRAGVPQPDDAVGVRKRQWVQDRTLENRRRRQRRRHRHRERHHADTGHARMADESAPRLRGVVAPAVRRSEQPRMSDPHPQQRRQRTQRLPT